MGPLLLLPNPTPKQARYSMTIYCSHAEAKSLRMQKPWGATVRTCANIVLPPTQYHTVILGLHPASTKAVLLSVKPVCPAASCCLHMWMLLCETQCSPPSPALHVAAFGSW